MLTAEFRDKDAQVTAHKATEIFERVRKKILENKISKLDLETSEFSVNEVREWEKDKVVSKGFQSRASLKISSSDFGFSSKVIGIALSEGVKDVSNLHNYVSNEVIDRARFDCLQEAVKNAKAKAEKMAEAAGARVGGVISLSESSGDLSPPSPPHVFMAKAMRGAPQSEAADNGPTIDAGKITIATDVSVSFELR